MRVLDEPRIPLPDRVGHRELGVPRGAADAVVGGHPGTGDEAVGASDAEAAVAGVGESGLVAESEHLHVVIDAVEGAELVLAERAALIALAVVHPEQCHAAGWDHCRRVVFTLEVHERLHGAGVPRTRVVADLDAGGSQIDRCTGGVGDLEVLVQVGAGVVTVDLGDHQRRDGGCVASVAEDDIRVGLGCRLGSHELCRVDRTGRGLAGRRVRQEAAGRWQREVVGETAIGGGSVVVRLRDDGVCIVEDAQRSGAGVREAALTDRVEQRVLRVGVTVVLAEVGFGEFPLLDSGVSSADRIAKPEHSRAARGNLDIGQRGLGALFDDGQPCRVVIADAVVGEVDRCIGRVVHLEELEVVLIARRARVVLHDLGDHQGRCRLRDGVVGIRNR